MGKLELGQRLGNTIVTPVRIGGEIGNAAANVPRQGIISPLKNIATVTHQTLDALVHNFTDFSKVEGKRYQRFMKGTVNLASALTRRPFTIASAGIASGLNQGIRQPFKKLLYTPGKMFKGMRNATRIFSKKKGYDFKQYDMHETGEDTRINQIRQQRVGFFGKGNVSSKEESSSEKKGATKKKSKSRWKIKKKKEKISESDSSEEHPSKKNIPAQENTSSSVTHPTSIDELQEKYKQESAAKEEAEYAKAYPEWSSLEEKKKTLYKKDYEKVLEGNLTEEGILARGKKHGEGDTIDQIIASIQKKNRTLAGYFKELLAKKNPASAGA